MLGSQTPWNPFYLVRHATLVPQRHTAKDTEFLTQIWHSDPIRCIKIKGKICEKLSVFNIFWIEHQTTNLGVGSSNLPERAILVWHTPEADKWSQPVSACCRWFKSIDMLGDSLLETRGLEWPKSDQWVTDVYPGWVSCTTNTTPGGFDEQRLQKGD